MKTLNLKYIQQCKIALCGLALSIFLIACEEEDPFVDRKAAPVLLVFDEVAGYLASGGLTSVPSVSKTVTAATYTQPVTLSVRLYELDKSGILDHTVGIDSIPVVGVTMTFSLRNGTSPIEAVSDAEGKVTITTSWENLGVTDVAAIVAAKPARSITIPLLWKGSHKGISFSRYSQVVFTKPAS
ncbi:MAG TPA: hypothetical protein VGD65_14425 [Chryseosolibacter sp.]